MGRMISFQMQFGSPGQTQSDAGADPGAKKPALAIATTQENMDIGTRYQAWSTQVDLQYECDHLGTKLSVHPAASLGMFAGCASQP